MVFYVRDCALDYSREGERSLLGGLCRSNLDGRG
jgi:hypothetical protein